MTTFECCARPKESRIGPHPKYLQSHLRLFLEKLLPMEAPSPHQIRQIPNLPPLRCMKNWKQFISTILSDLMRSMESWPHRISCGIGRLSPTFLAKNGHLLQSEVENPRLLVKLVVQITQKIQHCLLTTTKREPSWPAKKSSWQSWLPIWSPFWSAQDLASGCLKRGSMKKLLKSLCRKKK